MNNAIYLDASISDELRRQQLYEGHIFVYSPLKSSLAFVNFARSMIEKAFGGLDPRTAQHKLPVDDYAALLGKLKPAFIHHPESKTNIQRMFEEIGIDLDKTYFDVPRMRSSTSSDYLTSGIAYAWHPHRDTWFSAPACQINWWIPIYEIEADNAMAFHPRYWCEPVENSSAGYNYYNWNKLHRGASIAKLTKEDTRPLPKAMQPLESKPEIRLICPPGGIIMFSAAQMHSSVPNTSGVTRFSADFRVVNLDDVAERRGAPNLDAACTGTVLRDFIRGSDLTRMPQEVVALYDDGTESQGDLVYQTEPVVEAAASRSA